jgi:hypothetical protein
MTSAVAGVPITMPPAAKILLPYQVAILGKTLSDAFSQPLSLKFT